MISLEKVAEIKKINGPLVMGLVVLITKVLHQTQKERGLTGLFGVNFISERLNQISVTDTERVSLVNFF